MMLFVFDMCLTVASGNHPQSNEPCAYNKILCVWCLPSVLLYREIDNYNEYSLCTKKYNINVHIIRSSDIHTQWGYQRDIDKFEYVKIFS